MEMCASIDVSVTNAIRRIVVEIESYLRMKETIAKDQRGLDLALLRMGILI